MKENDTVVEADNTINRASKRTVLIETTMETNKLPAPDDSKFLLSSNALIQETFDRAENKNKWKNSNMDESLVILGKDAKHTCQHGNNGARNFGRGFAKILRRSKKTRWLLIRTGLSQSHASGPGELSTHPAS